MACNSRQPDEPVSIIWRDDKAVAILIPRQFFNNIEEDSIKDLVTVHLINGNDHPPILGENIVTDEGIRFEPLIALTPQYTYQVRLRGLKITDITIPPVSNAEQPELLSIFPSQDTVPQNLLKLYLHFSQPMREGQALKHIVLLSGKDTIPQIFLDLQPELWNQERTLLTLWLDPGRIKRELQPNKRLGEPLKSGQQYHLHVHQNWQDAKGRRLAKPFRKEFYISERDSLSPATELWRISAPSSESKYPLEVRFEENMDYVLAREAIEVLDPSGRPVIGETEITAEESIYHFRPKDQWTAGSYEIRIESRLEDLAGNNLNRIFDRDITQPITTVDRAFYSRKFRIE